MSEFKVGDKVKCIYGFGEWLKEGEVYTILAVYVDPTDREIFLTVNDNQPATERGMEEGGWNACRFVLVESSSISPLQKNNRVTDEAGNLGTVLAVREESGMVDVLFDKFGSNPLTAIRMPIGKVTRVGNVASNTPTAAPEYTGGSSSYYKVSVQNPVSKGEPYTVECQDVIEALGMSFSEGNIFKAIWRICAAKNGKAKKGYEDSVYDLEKIIFFAQRELEIEKRKRDK